MPVQTYYDYYPQSVLSLGLGFDPTNLSEPKTPAIIGTSRKLDGPGALRTATQFTLVRTTTQMKQTLGVDLAVDASFLLFKGSATFSFDQSVTTDSSSMTVVVSGLTEFSRVGLDPASLTLNAQASTLLAKPHVFAKAFGTHYCVMERRGAAVHAILTVANVAQSTRTQIDASMSASGGFGPLSASARAAFERELSVASKESRVTAQVVSTGGAGFGALADTVKSLLAHSNNLDALASAFRDYLATFTEATAVPIGFHCTSFAAFGLDPAVASLWSENQKRKLLEIVDRYRLADRAKSIIEGVLAGHDSRWRLVPAGGRAALRSSVHRLEECMDTLADMHEAVRINGAAAADLPMVDVSMENLVCWPPPEPKPSWRVVRDGAMLDPETSWMLLEGVGVVDAPDPADLVLVVDGYYFQSTRIFFGDSTRVVRFGRHDSSATTIELRGADVAFDEQIKALHADGMRDAAGTFFLEVGDVFGERRQFPIAAASWRTEADQPVATAFRLLPLPANLYGVRVPLANAPGVRPLMTMRRAAATSARAPSRVQDACEEMFPANASNCSGFVRAVAARLGVPFAGVTTADQILESMGIAPWRQLASGVAAAEAATGGEFVVGGLMSSELGEEHGHVVVVTPGPLNRDRYPTAYWGQFGGVGRRGATVNWAFTHGVLDQVRYFARPLP